MPVPDGAARFRCQLQVPAAGFCCRWQLEEVFRRIAGKVALLADKVALTGWLKLCQVAVGVRAGAEGLGCSK